jgi:hypothetical protein
MIEQDLLRFCLFYFLEVNKLTIKDIVANQEKRHTL